MPSRALISQIARHASMQCFLVFLSRIYLLPSFILSHAILLYTFTGIKVKDLSMCALLGFVCHTAFLQHFALLMYYIKFVPHAACTEHSPSSVLTHSVLFH